MYQFFDIDNADDLDLLHSEVRENPELGATVTQVQAENIQAFSQRDMQGLTTYQSFFQYEFGVNPTDVIRVRLLGYNEDDPEESDEGLKDVFKRSIAEVVTWVLRNYSNPQGVTSIRQGQRSVTYAGVVPSYMDFPLGWDRWFKNYDGRIQPYGI